MLFSRKAWLPAVGALIALGCSDGGTTGTTGTGGSGGATASSSTTATASATTGTGGGTTSSSAGTGGSIAYVPSGFACSGAMPSLKNDVVPITSASCTTGPSCHVALHTAGGVN